jgi:hypothetical protein
VNARLNTAARALSASLASQDRCWASVGQGEARQRRVEGANGREDRLITRIGVLDLMKPAERVDVRGAWVVAHPERPGFVVRGAQLVVPWGKRLAEREGLRLPSAIVEGWMLAGVPPATFCASASAVWSIVTQVCRSALARPNWAYARGLPNSSFSKWLRLIQLPGSSGTCEVRSPCVSAFPGA